MRSVEGQERFSRTQSFRLDCTSDNLVTPVLPQRSLTTQQERDCRFWLELSPAVETFSWALAKHLNVLLNTLEHIADGDSGVALDSDLNIVVLRECAAVKCMDRLGVAYYFHDRRLGNEHLLV